ncbi:MAG: hypothetical protein ACXWO1_14585 [Isosphaeraceae bacterium]|jgi:hypothetical protein
MAHPSIRPGSSSLARGINHIGWLVAVLAVVALLVLWVLSR